MMDTYESIRGWSWQETVQAIGGNWSAAETSIERAKRLSVEGTISLEGLESRLERQLPEQMAAPGFAGHQEVTPV